MPCGFFLFPRHTGRKSQYPQCLPAACRISRRRCRSRRAEPCRGTRLKRPNFVWRNAIRCAVPWFSPGRRGQPAGPQARRAHRWSLVGEVRLVVFVVRASGLEVDRGQAIFYLTQEVDDPDEERVQPTHVGVQTCVQCHTPVEWSVNLSVRDEVNPQNLSPKRAPFYNARLPMNRDDSPCVKRSHYASYSNTPSLTCAAPHSASRRGLRPTCSCPERVPTMSVLSIGSWGSKAAHRCGGDQDLLGF